METAQVAAAEVRTPFGLTFGEPARERHQVADRWSAAVLDADRQIAMLDGRPLAETMVAGAAAGSSPTETDGKDPIAVDSDPLYD